MPDGGRCFVAENLSRIIEDDVVLSFGRYVQYVTSIVKLFIYNPVFIASFIVFEDLCLTRMVQEVGNFVMSSCPKLFNRINLKF